MPSRRALLVTGVLLVSSAGRVGAQRLVSLAPGGELGGEYRGSWHRVSGRELRTGTDFIEWFQVPIAGRLLGPRFFQYRVALRPELRQSTFTGADEPLKGRQLGLGASGELFPVSPISFRLTASRAAGSSNGGLGADNRFRTSSAGVTSTWRNPWFPIQVGFTTQNSLNDLQSTPTSTQVRTAYGLKTYNASGNSSKLSLRYSRTEFDDQETGSDYSAWTASLLHQIRWGKGSRLETGLERTNQSGSLDFDRDDWFERLHIQHARTASSEVQFRRSVIDARGLPSKIDSWNYQFSTALGRHLSAGLAAGHAIGHFQTARDASSTITPRVGFDLVMPARLRLQGDVAAGVEWRKFTGAGLISIQVSDESHGVDQTRSFFLDQLDADGTSLVLRASGSGLVYSEGTDYVLTPIGRELRVDVAPGGRIAVGDRLLVSYRYSAPGDTDQRALDLNYHVAASRGPVRLDHTRSLRADGDPTAAVSRGVSNFDETRTRLLVHTRWQGARVDLEGTTETRERAGITRSELGAGADLGMNPSPTLATAFGVHWSRSRAAGDEARAITARSITSWSASASLQLHLSLETLLWSQSRVPDDRFYGGSLDVVWYVFALEAVGRYEYSRRTGPLDLNGHRVSTRLIRRF
jgi:hypothetical protein